MAGFQADGVFSRMAPDTAELNTLLEELRRVCLEIKPLLDGNLGFVLAIDAAVQTLGPRLDEAVAVLRRAVQAQTEALEEAAAALKKDAGEAVTALETVPAKAQEAGAAIDALRSTIEGSAQAVAEARGTYAQVVEAGVDAMELALEAYGAAAQEAASNLAAAHKETGDALKGLAAALDGVRDTRVDQETRWAEQIDELVEASAEVPGALAQALAEAADEAVSGMVASVNADIEVYNEMVESGGTVYPRFMVVDGDAFTNARDALLPELEELGDLIAQRQEEVSTEELAILGQLSAVSRGLPPRHDELRAVEGLNE